MESVVWPKIFIILIVRQFILGFNTYSNCSLIAPAAGDITNSVTATSNKQKWYIE
eukprot:Gb_10842 [translate_table: standard]